jgi:polyhydroxyalkanoate synthesis regulator phasin
MNVANHIDLAARDVLELSESAVYDVEERDYVRKAEVDEEVKESRLQGLKDRLAQHEEPEAAELREEIDDLEARIDDLTSFNSGQMFHSQS